MRLRLRLRINQRFQISPLLFQLMILFPLWRLSGIHPRSWEALAELGNPNLSRGRTLRTLKLFYFNVVYISRAHPTLRTGLKESLLLCPISRTLLRSGSNPDFWVLLMIIQNGSTTGIFVTELKTNFGPFDKSTEIEHELSHLHMKDTQCISDYLVHFNSLAVHCPWGDSALRYRFYEGLPTQLKDEICKGDGKPNTLLELKKKAQNIDTWYWEHVQEHSREQNHHPTNQSKPSSSNTSTTSSSTPKPASTSGSKPGKSKETLKP